MSPEKIAKVLLKKEEEIIIATGHFCWNHNIEWTKKHDDCLKNGLREFFRNGIYPIVKKMFHVKRTRFKITRHATGKTTTTKTGSKKMSAKPKLDRKTTDTGTPDRNKQKKSKKRDLSD